MIKNILTWWKQIPLFLSSCLMLPLIYASYVSLCIVEKTIKEIPIHGVYRNVYSEKKPHLSFINFLLTFMHYFKSRKKIPSVMHMQNLYTCNEHKFHSRWFTQKKSRLYIARSESLAYNACCILIPFFHLILIFELKNIFCYISTCMRFFVVVVFES